MSECDAGDDFHPAIYEGSPDEYRSAGSDAVLVVEGPEGGRSTGTLTVPEGTAPGLYTVTVACTTPLPPLPPEGGEITLELDVKESSFEFEVTS